MTLKKQALSKNKNLIKVALVSLGCDKNLVDSEIMLARLKEEGFLLTSEPSVADAIIVNTCGFIDAAKEESIQVLLGMARYKEGNCRVLLAAGCLAERYRAELLAELPELDGIVGVNDFYGIALALRRALAGEKALLTAGEYRAPDDAPRLQSTPSHTAYLKIAEGCNNRCTYCAIPLIRGPYRSRERASLLREAKMLAGYGVRELNLIAQDITLYGIDQWGRPDLPGLLCNLAALEGLHWLRLLYAYPERLDDRLIETVAREKKICKYLDIPLQHSSDKVLHMMGRSLTGEKALALLEKLRREIPGVVLRSTFIVGFPGEGESEFGELLSFLAEARLDRAGFFMYSREEGTPAAGFPGQVDDEVKQERLLRAEALQSRILDEKNRLLHGQILEAMVDGPSAQDPGVTLARTAGQAPGVDGYVRLRGALRPGGRTVLVRITGSEGVDLLGEIVST